MNDTDQIQAALQLANRNRIHMAETKRAVRTGDLDWRDVLQTDDPALQRIRVVDLLLCVRGVGRVKAEKAMGRSGVLITRRIGQITPRQRERLLEEPLRATVGTAPASLMTVAEELRLVLGERDVLRAENETLRRRLALLEGRARRLELAA